MHIVLELILQCKLDETRCNRRLIDHTEARCSHSRSRILVLGVVPHVEELRTKGQRCILILFTRVSMDPPFLLRMSLLLLPAMNCARLAVPYAVPFLESVKVSGLPDWKVETPENFQPVVVARAIAPAFFSAGTCQL